MTDRKEYLREYRVKNKQRIKFLQERYYEENKEKLKNYFKEYYIKTRNKRRELGKNTMKRINLCIWLIVEQEKL